jgi:hypothetical protein
MPYLTTVYKYVKYLPVPSKYLDHLRTLPALRRCSRHELRLIASIVDEVDLPSGRPVGPNGREVLVTMSSTRVLVIDRRALPMVATLAPELFTSP